MKFDLVEVTRWKLLKLSEWQPKAIEILDGWRCPNCKSPHTLTYNLPDTERRQLLLPFNEPEESCGFYCPSCNFANASYRIPITGEEEFLTFEQWDLVG